MSRQIVVGVDGQEGGRDAIALAKRLLAPEGELTLAHVYAGDPRAHRRASAAYEAARQLARTARCPPLVLPRSARKSETPEQRRTVGRL